MRWQWWRKRGPAPAEEALEEARQARETARARGAEIRSISDRLRQIREENHFAESIRRALGDL